ncbi:dipeptide ABC transporter ATP-binding protein [Pseudonocardia nematodicida]|uniref:dipeptide ABC transporter ATP-binding protein n=1 Tax=Pseudonocardia nematodicida TaxID=1206997 RepID=UPI00361C5B67
MPRAPAGDGGPGEPGLSVEGLEVTYAGVAGGSVALSGVGLRAAPGRITAVVGESGSGKSTLAHAVIGLLPGSGRITAGGVRLGGTELTGLDRRGWRRVRGARIGLVPQDPGVALDPLTPVGRQVADVLRIHERTGRREARDRAVEALAGVGLPDPAVRARQYPHELSGGMRQRVLIAIATVARPELVVADEPTSALDVTVARRILDLLRAVADAGTAVLLVTHDLGVVADRADDVVVLAGGRAVESGPAPTVLTAGSAPATRRLLTAAPALRPPERRDPAGDGGAPDTPGPIVRVRDLRVSFPDRGGGRTGTRRTAVDGVSFTVARGRTLGLVGESGSGKTTIARTLLGLQAPDSGSLDVDGHDPAGPDRAGLRRLHRRVQLVAQNPYSAMHPGFTVAEIVGEPLRNAGVRDRRERAETVASLLDGVALPAGTAARRASELSGGQRQRVAIARALAVGPDLLVCDEPVSALDVGVQAQILDLLVDLQRERGLSYLFITHDLGVVRHVSDDVAVLRGGRIVESGPTTRVLTDPRTPYTRELLDAVPGLRRLTPPLEEDHPWTSV